jgi:hypothetical protein
MSLLPEMTNNERKTLKQRLGDEFVTYMESINWHNIPVQDRDNGKYNAIKYTVLPAGTRLRFRSNRYLDFLQNRPIWADYSQTLGKPSFLDEDEDYSKGMEYYFGPYMNTIELLQDLTILHMPVNYGHVTTPNITRNTTRRLRPKNRITRNMNVTADMESFVRILCVPGHRKRFETVAKRFKNVPTTVCRDGYTMDFFYRLGGPAAEKFREIREKLFPKMAGWREICITNVSPKTVRLVESVYMPTSP